MSPNPTERLLFWEAGQADGLFRGSFVEIHPSARKHGVDDEDIRHAIDRALATEDAGEDCVDSVFGEHRCYAAMVLRKAV
jgi:hypothetical protein